jgi:hypothetical protein
MRCPAEVYRASPRAWQANPPEAEYPGHGEVLGSVGRAR